MEPQAAVTIVGSRRATSYGREVARDLARELAAAGMVVISGLAFGIDACAHRGALDAAGRRSRCSAVVPTALTRPLTAGSGGDRPDRRRDLRAAARLDPLALELPGPQPGDGGARRDDVVVEAAARSGSLITADLAAELGRDLGAVPGPVTSRASAGPNDLLAGGACVVRDGQDVLDAMLGAGRPPARRGVARHSTPRRRRRPRRGRGSGRHRLAGWRAAREAHRRRPRSRSPGWSSSATSPPAVGTFTPHHARPRRATVAAVADS